MFGIAMLMRKGKTFGIATLICMAAGGCVGHREKTAIERLSMIEYPTSLEDPRLDVYARLTELQLRNRLEPEKGIFIAESDKVIDRALAAGYQPISLLVPEHRFERMAGLVDRIGGNKPAEEGGLTVFVMPAEEVEKLAGYELTRGVLCAMRRKPLPSVEETVANARRIAILEDITNHTNVGAAFRSAAALGVDAVLCTPACCDPLYRHLHRKTPSFYKSVFVCSLLLCQRKLLHHTQA